MDDLFSGEVPPKHYYGDSVRKLLLAASVVIVATLPWLYNQWPFTFYVWFVVAFSVVVFAGITNPRLRIVSLFDFAIASAGFLFFGFEGIRAVETVGAASLLFFTAETLMLIFLFDVYFTVKTIRGMILRK